MRTTVLDFVVAGERRIPCAACEERIGIVLRRLPGVEKAEASAQSQHVKVVIESGRSITEEVRAELAQLGYETRLEGVGVNTFTYAERFEQARNGAHP